MKTTLLVFLNRDYNEDGSSFKDNFAQISLESENMVSYRFERRYNRIQDSRFRIQDAAFGGI